MTAVKGSEADNSEENQVPADPDPPPREMAEPPKAIRPSKSSRQPLLRLSRGKRRVCLLVRVAEIERPPRVYLLVIKVAPESRRFSIVLPAILTGGPTTQFSPGGRTTPPLSKAHDAATASARTPCFAHRRDWQRKVMDFLRERLERDDPVEAVGVELLQLLDIAQAILWPNEHAVLIQHVGEADRRILEPRNVHKTGPRRKDLALPGTTMMKRVVHQREHVGAFDVVDRRERPRLKRSEEIGKPSGSTKPLRPNWPRIARAPFNAARSPAAFSGVSSSNLPSLSGHITRPIAPHAAASLARLSSVAPARRSRH